MRAQVLTGQGWKGIEQRDLPEPVPGPREVIVQVEACSLSFRDLLVARTTSDRIPLSDGAGRVVAVGEEVTEWSVGDHVAGCFFPRWLDGRATPAAVATALGADVDGMLAERVALPADGVVAVPAGWSSAEAATLPCAALTAWNALVEGARVRPGQTVLLLGTGGVSVFGLQFAKMLGARAIITSSRDEKLARMAELGADVTINYAANPDWDHEVLESTDGEGVDVVLEVGGEGTFARSVNCVRLGGEIALIGMVSGQGLVDPYPILQRRAVVRGVYVGSRRMFTEMVSALEVNGTRPLVGATFGFDEAVDAYRYLRSQDHVGKIVITL